MKITDGVSDALKLSQGIHNDMKELQRKIDELEYLICLIDERVKIEFFQRGENDKRGSQKGTEAD